jgi:hypothetical protein
VLESLDGVVFVLSYGTKQQEIAEAYLLSAENTPN